MFISLNWIKDFVDLSGVDENTIVSKFTLSCAEIEDVYHKGQDLSGVITAKIKSVENHPSSTKLHVLSVFDGNSDIKVVCGAPNVRVGMVTAFAPVGAVVSGQKISMATLAGVESLGMCCSAKELGITDDHSGILDLGDDTKVGVDIKSILPIDDTIIEVDNKSLTNRPDMWGHYGIAREISAITGRPLKPYPIDESDYSALPKPDVKVSSKSCYRYSALRMGGITKNVSPMTMQIRLHYAGMRAISLLADLTNYIMLELGQPMHSFDGTKVKSIDVKDLSTDTKFVTLDGVERLLPAGTMVIDLNGQIGAVAGVMGGLSSEIESTTTSTFLESATFEAVKVRKTATALGLRSESSARYEKSLDPEMTTTALRRYVYLLKSIDSGARVESNIADEYKFKYPHVCIDIDKPYIDRYVGIDIPAKKIVEILQSIGFGVKQDGENFKIDVPSFRATKDISLKCDIVEEIARIYGYDNITPQPIVQPIVPSRLDKVITRDYDLKFALADKYSMHEIHSYIWEDSVQNASLGIKTNSYIRLVNSLQKDNDDIRSSMLPTIIRALNQNKRYSDDFGLFEIGHIVTGKNPLAVEEKALGMGWCFDKNLVAEKLESVKNIVHYLFKFVLNLPVKISAGSVTENYLSPVNYFEVFCSGECVGKIGIVHPLVQQKIDKDKMLVVCELNVSRIKAFDSVEFKVDKVSKYPVTTLDFNFLLGCDELYGKLETIAESIKTDLKYSTMLVDIFENPDGKTKSYTLRYFVTSMDHTLSSAEIEKFHKDVIATFEKNGVLLKA